MVLEYAIDEMIDLPIDFCARAAAARRELRLSQSMLAREIGCKQSALSMFEAGNPTKLSGEYVEKLSKRLGIPLKPSSAETGEENPPAPECAGAPAAAFCPSFACISNIPYALGGRLFYRPSTVRVASGCVRHCAHCGEILETACPSCGAPVNEGACCAVCGAPYIAAQPIAGDAGEWSAARRNEIDSLRKFFRPASAP